MLLFIANLVSIMHLPGPCVVLPPTSYMKWTLHMSMHLLVITMYLHGACIVFTGVQMSHFILHYLVIAMYLPGACKVLITTQLLHEMDTICYLAITMDLYLCAVRRVSMGYTEICTILCTNLKNVQCYQLLPQMDITHQYALSSC